MRKGFTLIELLLVIGIIAILASIVIIAINPTKQKAEDRDEQRRSDAHIILNAVYEYAIENDGDLPGGIDSSVQEICKTDAPDCEGLLDLSILTGEGAPIVAMPIDPNLPADHGTDYTIMLTEEGLVTVTAVSAENSVISVTR